MVEHHMLLLLGHQVLARRCWAAAVVTMSEQLTVATVGGLAQIADYERKIDR